MLCTRPRTPGPPGAASAESPGIPWRREPIVSDAFLIHLRSTLAEIDAAGLTKRERLIAGPQGGAHQGRRRRRDARDAQPLRQQLSRPRRSPGRDRRRQGARSTNSASAWPRCASSAARRPCTASSSCAIARHLGKDDAILFAACFDANGGVFEPLLGEDDAIISDALNHASIIDGVRLAKARRYRYANSDMNELEDRLKQADADGARFKLIATDGVFSMDGARRQARRTSARSPNATARWCWSTIATRPGISATRAAARRR